MNLCWFLGDITRTNYLNFLAFGWNNFLIFLTSFLLLIWPFRLWYYFDRLYFGDRKSKVGLQCGLFIHFCIGFIQSVNLYSMLIGLEDIFFLFRNYWIDNLVLNCLLLIFQLDRVPQTDNFIHEVVMIPCKIVPSEGHDKFLQAWRSIWIEAVILMIRCWLCVCSCGLFDRHERFGRFLDFM